MIIKDPASMNRKEKIAHIRYLKKSAGNAEAMKFWVSWGSRINRASFEGI